MNNTHEPTDADVRICYLHDIKFKSWASKDKKAETT